MINKKKIVFVTIVILVLILASNTQAKTIKQNYDHEIETDVEPSCIGRIEGRVGNSHGLYYWEPYIFALVDAEVKQTRTGLLGWYRMFLPLNNEYQITAYKSGFKPMTKEVTLTTEHPYRELNFDFFESEPVNSRTKNSHITPYIDDVFLFGKVSNVRRGGYTPAYWFHIDKVMTYGNQDPRVQWIEDREGFMLSMDFRGFIFRGAIIIGKVSSLLIYD